MLLLNCMVVAEVNSGNYFSRSDEKLKSCEEEGRGDRQKYMTWQGKGGEVEKEGLMKSWQ